MADTTNTNQDEEQQQQNTTEAADTDTTPEAEAKQDNTADNTETDSPAEDDLDALKQQLQEALAHNKKLNAENAERRVKAKESGEKFEALKAQLLAAFGEGDGQDDPEEALKAAQKQADEYRTKLNRYEETQALSKAVRKAGGDPDLMVPFLRGANTLPAWGEDDYEAQVAEIIKDTLEAKPALRSQAVPRSSGQAPTPTKSQPGMLDREQLAEMAARGEWDAINKAAREGRIKN